MVSLVEVYSKTDTNYFKSFLPTVNPPPPVAVLRDGGGASGFRQFNTEYPDHEQRRPHDGEFRVLSFDSHPAEVPREKEKSKKDKKWSIGKLFRRKKKEDESGSSSGSDEGISTRSETKRKVKKKKRPTAVSVSNFDHIVVNRGERRAQSLIKQNTKDILDEGVLSDPSAGFAGYRGRALPHVPIYLTPKDSLHPRDDSGSRSVNSMDGSVRRGRKGRMKARVEALRNSMRKDSSSDEESQKSSTSSSILRFRSDDSLMNNSHSRDGSLNRKSRSARTERYIKRLSRDEENQLNKEAELLQQGYTKAEVEMLTRTPTSQSSGYGTSKKENTYANTRHEAVYSNDLNRRPLKSESISSFPSTHSYPSSINFNAKINNDTVQYSIPYARNSASKEPMYVNQDQDRRTVERQSFYDNKIMCVKFPLGNVTNVSREEKAPPVPPPRDLQRKVATPVSMLLETEQARNRNGSQDRPIVHGVPNNDFQRIMRRSQERSFNPAINGLRRPMSNSEDHIAVENQEHFRHSNLRASDQPRRPASVSVEPNHYGLYANAPWRKKLENSALVKPEPVKHEFLYYADQSPRSRRPISIQSSQTNLDKQCLSDSQSSLNHYYNNMDWTPKKPRNASEFWRKIDTEECKRQAQNFYPLSRTTSEHSTPSAINFRVGMQNNVPRSNCEQVLKRNLQINGVNSNHAANRLTLHNSPRDIVDSSHKWKSATEYSRPLATEIPCVVNPPQRTHVRHKSETQITSSYKSPSDDEKTSERRKSTNLDDALNELEAIYNSLGLGDEDLLDRAERRELMSPKSKTCINDWNGNDEMQLRSQPITPLKRHPIPRRSTLPDKLQDDMAFRRLNCKEKPVNKESPTAQISYMLSSPLYVPYVHDDDKNSEGDPQEPDVVQDDVVYRNIRHANSYLKQLEPQPPFGIPVGPVTPAPQSDYLHATPENKTRSRFVPRRSPDLVSDDLAYRALRKDNRHSSLFGEDYESNSNNNSSSYNEPTFTKDSADSLRKKRAVRSLSANIFSMIQKEIDEALNMSKLATLQKAQSISDVNKNLQQSNSNNNSEASPRNKVKQRHNTVNIFVSSMPTSPSTYKKDDNFSSKDEKYLSKPPVGEKSKSSSPANRSPQPAKKPAKDEFQQVLALLAQEAMDTSNKLGVALAEIDKNRKNTERLSNSQARAQFLSSLSNRNSINETFHKIQPVKAHSETNDAKIDQPETKTIETNKGQKTKDSLLAISNQLHKVEDKLKHSFERVVNVPDESVKLSSYMVEKEEKLKADECKIAVPENKTSPVIMKPNVQQDIVIVNNDTDTKHSSSTLNSIIRAKDNELNELKSFNDLKEGISDLLAGISQVNNKLFKENCNNENNPEEKTDSARNSVARSVYEDDLVNNKDNSDTAEYNSSEELATIFKLDEKTSDDNKNEIEEGNCNPENEDKHSDLNSPRLVQSINQKLRRLSNDSTENQSDNVKPSHSNTAPTVPWRTKKHNAESQSEKKNCVSEGKSRAWYRDPGSVMLACSYSLVCSQQIVDMDWLTLLGLLLAIITIIAMLVI